MRESTFIKRNLPRWKKYQEESTNDPDEMADRFTSLLDDLAYAKTFYSFSKVTGYINSLAANIYQLIYGNRKDKDGRFKLFFVYELPLIFRKHHRLLLFTFLVFGLFSAIGAFSAAHDETFVRGVLGDEYVSMTDRNISEGNPFGVYQRENPLVMALSIAWNNTYIAFKCFVGGIAFGLITLFFMVENGIMLGSFQYYFFAKGLGLKSVLVIWIHGTLEISAIVLASCAGFVITAGLLFPGTRKRVDSLKRATKEGVKMMVSLVPVFATAAFLEGFVTRHTEMPMVLSASILGVSLAFILGYFVIYPIRLSRKGYYLDEAGNVVKPVVA
jgi:uncharacterized membrane protein SpoIIM required for sporulation